jgi:hypothetical protein
MENLSFAALADGVIAAYTGRDPSFEWRLSFWIAHFGDRPITSITTDDIEDGIDALVKRGKMRAVWIMDADGQRQSVYIRTGRELSGSTVNRHVAALGSMFRILKEKRRLPRGFVNPTKGASRMPDGESRTLSVTVEDVRRLAGRMLVEARRLAVRGDWEAIDALLEQARQQFAGYPWVSEVLANLERIARSRDLQRFSKESLYSTRRMSTRLCAKGEALDTLNEATVPSFLRRKQAQGKAQSRKGDDKKSN